MKNIEEVLRREAEHAEANKDAPERADVVATRPGGGRARILSIRLAESEALALDIAAKRTGLPASTLARTWIAEKLAAEGDTTDVRAIADALATFSERLSRI